MIRGFTVTNPSGEVAEFTLSRPEDTGCLVTDISGLGTPKANILTQTVYGMDGALFNSARTETRNIVFSFAMLDGMAPEGRRRIYKAFPLKQLVTVKFITKQREYQARGYVESVTPNIFSEREAVQVSILCPQPYLETPGRWQTGIGFFNVVGGMTFPMNGPNIAFGTQARRSGIVLDYPGEVVSGFKWYIALTGQPGLVSLYNHTREELLQIDMDLYQTISGRAPVAGDLLEIDSRPESFGAIMTRRDKTTFHATGIVTANSVWPMLQPGDNQLEMYTSKSKAVDITTEISVYFTPLYMGL